MDRAHVSRDPS
uniref:Uncharacterized protein n=1 Tax=Arundo donax TaxID=35708 RepID=A0A0A8ZRJ1_ARUDO